jgi:hypothetical protein
MRRRRVAEIRNGEAAGAWRWRPAHHDHFALGICIPDDRRRKIGKHAGHRRQVADIAVQHAEGRNDGRLVGRNRIEITPTSA